MEAWQDSMWFEMVESKHDEFECSKECDQIE